jgi:hypothetical protein
MDVRKHLLFFSISLLFLTSILSQGGLNNSISVNQEDQWNLDYIRIPAIWSNYTTGSSETVVALIDSGIMWDDDILSYDSRWENIDEINGATGVDDDNNGFVDDFYGYDFAEWDNAPSRDANGDLVPSGTIMASVIAASHDNSEMKGIAPGIKIMDVRVIGSDGWTYQSTTYQGVEYAIDKNVSAIIIPIHFVDEINDPFKELVQEAFEKNIPIIVNSGEYDFQKFALLEDFITVGGIHENGISNYTPEGENLDFLAPGENIQAYNGIEVSGYGGSTFAAAHVTGVIALLKSIRNDLSVIMLEEVLRYSATDVGDNGKDSTSGYGIIDAQASMYNWYNFDSLDFDNDGMTSDYEVKYDLNPFDATDADLDPDDDGLSNLEEFIEGSDPHDAEDPNSGFLSYDYIFGLIGIVILPVLIRIKKR